MSAVFETTCTSGAGMTAVGAVAAQKNETGRGIEERWRLYRENPENHSLRNALVEFYMPLVRKHAKLVYSKLGDRVTLEDLISTGSLGLLGAVEMFNPDLGIRFEVYCARRVQGAMLDELRALDWVPRKSRSMLNKVQKASMELEMAIGRKPAEEEIAHHLGLPVDDIHRTIIESISSSFSSLDKPWGGSQVLDQGNGGDILPAKDVEQPFARLERQEQLRTVTRGLSKNERLVILLYYYEELTLKEIGMVLGLSESRVSQIHSTVLARIKNACDPSDF